MKELDAYHIHLAISLVIVILGGWGMFFNVTTAYLIMMIALMINSTLLIKGYYD